MAKAPAKKKSAAPKAAKKKAAPIKATPTDLSDREHLVEVIKAGTGCTGVAARDTLSAVLGTLQASLKKNQKVSLAGFGTFAVTRRSARKGVNPRTGEPIKIKASKSVRFKPGRTLKTAV